MIRNIDCINGLHLHLYIFLFCLAIASASGQQRQCDAVEELRSSKYLDAGRIYAWKAQHRRGIPSSCIAEHIDILARAGTELEIHLSMLDELYLDSAYFDNLEDCIGRMASARQRMIFGTLLELPNAVVTLPAPPGQSPYVEKRLRSYGRLTLHVIDSLVSWAVAGYGLPKETAPGEKTDQQLPEENYRLRLTTIAWHLCSMPKLDGELSPETFASWYRSHRRSMTFNGSKRRFEISRR